VIVFTNLWKKWVGVNKHYWRPERSLVEWEPENPYLFPNLWTKQNKVCFFLMLASKLLTVFELVIFLSSFSNQNQPLHCTYFMLSFSWPFKLFMALHVVSIPIFFTLLPPLHLHHSLLQGGSNHVLQENLSNWIVVATMMTKYAFCVNGVSQFCLLKLCFKLFVSSSAGLSSGCSSFCWWWILFQWR